LDSTLPGRGQGSRTGLEGGDSVVDERTGGEQVRGTRDQDAGALDGALP
jgi:hypothetical protein